MENTDLQLFKDASTTGTVFGSSQDEMMEIVERGIEMSVDIWAGYKSEFDENIIAEVCRVYGQLDELHKSILDEKYISNDMTPEEGDDQSHPHNRLTYFKYVNNTRLSKLGAFAVIRHPSDPDLILGVARGHTGEFASNFGFPGGTVDNNENIKDAMVREIREETGLIVEKCIPLFFDDEPVDNFLVGVYLVTEFSGEIKESNEGKVEWVTWDDVKSGRFGIFNTKLHEQYLKLKIN